MQAVYDLKRQTREAHHLTLYKHGNLLKRVDVSLFRMSRRLLIVELVLDLGVSKTATANALKISKQTVCVYQA